MAIEQRARQCSIPIVADSGMEPVRLEANSSFFREFLHNVPHPAPQVEIAFVTAGGSVVCTSGFHHATAGLFAELNASPSPGREGGFVHVKPGVYGAVTVGNTKFVTNHLAYTFTVQSTDGPEKTIIDGGGLIASDDGNSASSPTRACFWYGDNPVPLYDTIRGFSLRNSIYGVYNGKIEQCIVSNCWTGVAAASAFNCLIVGNKRIGFGSNGGLVNCTVAGNRTGVTGGEGGEIRSSGGTKWTMHTTRHSYTRRIAASPKSRW